jgi:DnaK suppressor protein
MQSIEQIAEEALQNRRSTIERRARERSVGDLTSPPRKPNSTVAAHLAWHDHLEEHEETELREIDGALDRIKQRSYGHCEDCGDVIGRQRLRASPEARRCLACADATVRRRSG